MLDTGHLMSTNWRIASQKQGIAYILEMIEKHGSLAEKIRGLHFHQSLSGAYCRKNVSDVPADFPEEYFAAAGYSLDDFIGMMDSDIDSDIKLYCFYAAIAEAEDIYLTGDLKYYDFQKADGKMILVDIGHYESEQFAKELICRVISEKFCNFACQISEKNRSYIQFI